MLNQLLIKLKESFVTRLDNFLFQEAYYESRSKAKAAIKEGKVKVNGEVVLKPALLIDKSAEVECEKLEFVSRAGAKLEQAFSTWQFDLKSAVCMDIGASTGGFTELMLKNGAKKVYAIDVGVGQLHPKLASDERVVNLENTNIRYFDFASICEKIDFISVDVSFISLTYVLPVISDFVQNGATLVCLIKPQFEVGKALIGKNGIVKSKKAHLSAVKKVRECAESHSLIMKDVIVSDVKGSKGNTEFLALLTSCVSD